jgi:tRNA1Val (adenine37-N6)-methyltransferase
VSFPPEALTCDSFLEGRLRLWQPRHGYRAAIDPVLLAAFIPARAGEVVLEIGCGAGTALLCLGRRVPGLVLHGVEVQPDYADLARRNAAENGIPASIHACDFRAMPAVLRSLHFDNVLMNPPYFAEKTATAAGDPGRDAANREAEGAGLGTWIDAGLRRLRPGGRLVLVQRTERLAEILAALGARAGSVEILPLAPREGRPAVRVLVRARKGRKAPLALLAPLTLHQGGSHLSDGDDYTDIARSVLRHMAELTRSNMLRDARLGGNED